MYLQNVIASEFILKNMYLSSYKINKWEAVIFLCFLLKYDARSKKTNLLYIYLCDLYFKNQHRYPKLNRYNVAFVRHYLLIYSKKRASFILSNLVISHGTSIIILLLNALNFVVHQIIYVLTLKFQIHSRKVRIVAKSLC